MIQRLFVAALAIGGLCAALAAQDHPGQYSQADVDAGTRVYNAQCAQCHGPNGDQVSGIDLRLGRFRRASSDEDLSRVITTGVASVGMPPFALQPAELTGIVAFIRAGFDRTAVAVRVASPRAAAPCSMARAHVQRATASTASAAASPRN